MIFQTCVNIFFFLTACFFIFLVFHNRLPNEILHSTSVVAFISNELIKKYKGERMYTKQLLRLHFLWDNYEI